VENDNAQLQLELKMERSRMQRLQQVMFESEIKVQELEDGFLQLYLEYQNPGSGRDGLGVIEALAQSMRQIQELQVKALAKNQVDEEAPEMVKTAVTSLPLLGVPEGDQCGLLFQDWMTQVTTSMQDLSAGSGMWWEAVKKAVITAYSRWLGSTPLERLSIEPAAAHELVEGKWIRVNARACAMVVQSEQESGQQYCRSSKVPKFLEQQRFDDIDYNYCWKGDVLKYQQHLQAEVENIASDAVVEVNVHILMTFQDLPRQRGLRNVLHAEQKIIDSETALQSQRGQPILSWEALLQAAAKVAGAAPSEPKAPSIKVLSLHSGPSGGKHETAYALVDSGATHPLRRASGIGEWQAASPVVVHLAGGEVVELRMNSAGTLLVPSSGMTRTASTAPIVPLGSLVGVLGYRMEWHGSRCRLTSREGDVLNLRVRDGCPEVTEQQALDLIAKIEDKKLQTLRTSTEATKGAVRESMLVLNRSWFDHLISYCRSGIGSEALSAIQSAPFFQEVPQEALRGLSEADPISNGWDALRGLQHLNRRTRKKLWASKNWVVHLFAGKKQNEEVMFLERQGFAVLELDIERGKSHDLCNPLVWRAIEWAARNGRISTVIGGPPQSTFMLRRSMRPGPEALRSNEFPYGGWNGQSDKDRRVVDRHTGLFAKMIYLHALATAGRCAYPSEPGDFKEVGFMLEQPRDPRGYLLFSDPLAVDAVSFWRTSLWILYAEEAGLSTFSFDMSSLGKALSRQTTVGTNLPLRQIDGLKGRVQDDPYPPEHAPPSVWTREFSEIVSIAVREQRITPRMLKMSAEQWKDHVRKGHLPFSGPLKIPGLDADARGELDADLPSEEGSFDFEELKPEEVEEKSKEVQGDIGGVDEVPEGEAEELDDEDDPQPPAPDPGEALDVTGPDTVNLVFATAMIDNKGATVLEAIQDVVMYCWSLNIPIVRFHCDRGMEFYAKATRQWVKYHGMRFTTSEGGLHQQNGMVENAVRYIKQRARTLLIGAKLPQRLWPQAITMAASMQRASVLGMETRLAAPFGAKVLVRRREYGGTAEPGKPDDLAPRWLEGRYLGLSETVRRGHLVYLSGDDGEKFIHTVNVRVGLEDHPLPGPEVEADLPGPPSRRLRGKASGSGDVVSVSKAETVVGSEDLKFRAQKLLEEWSQEEAEKLLVHVALSLNPNDRVFGVFRHGGRVGLTKATYDHPWIAEIFVKALVGRCPEAEFSAVYVSVNTTREIHIDSNNLTGMSNYVYPLAMPSKGGGLWIELADGDVVRGKIVEMQDKKGHGHFGCVQPLLPGHVVSFNPHRRHAVLPWKGLRVVFVGYTPGVPQNLLGPEREVLSRLGFPVPSEVEQSSPFVALRVLSVAESEDKSLLQEEIEPQELEQGSAIAISDGSVLFHEVPRGEEYGAPAEGALVGRTEELDCWDMYLPLAEGDPQKVPKAMSASSVGVPVVAKAEVTYTKGIEVLLSNLQSPLTIVHTVDPAEAAASFKEWVKPAEKEILSFDKAAKKVLSSDPQIIADLRSGKAKIVPMKVVYTVKPPSEEAALEGQLYRRKVRIVACGNMMAESGEDTYAAAAPAEVVRSSLSVASMNNWDAAVLDVTAAFLQTPLSEVRCQQRILGQPPRALVRAGLCGEKELWEFTHAVYGLRESPRWWGEFRDSQMAQLNIVVGSKRIKLLQCRVEGSWWRLVDDRALVGLVVIYVDDLLICSTPTIIKAVSEAVKSLWETSSLSWASEGGIRFLGIEISKVEGGFALNQEPYIKELTRIHSIAETQRDLVPVSKEMSSFTAESDEAVFTTSELREAQQVAGEVLWVSQRTRPDIAYVASLISSLSARAPRRAVKIGKKCMGFLQRTAQQHLWIRATSPQLTAWTDASYAPDGGRSHTGWLITLGEAPINWRSARQSTITLSTAESELGASVEGALALISAEALLSELDLDMTQSRLRTDSTSSLAIQRGSGSWRTRHLRIKAGWICERLVAGDLELEHWPGDRQLADILTKPLSSMRIRQLSQLIGLAGPHLNGFKVLVAMMVLSQAVSAQDPTGMAIYEPMAVDRGLMAWCMFAVIALLWTAAWELIKYAGWQIYFSATPGASSRRLRRLQRIRDTTTEAIRSELTRSRPTGDGNFPVERRRAQDAERNYESSSSSRGRGESTSRIPNTPIVSRSTVYQSDQRDKAVQTTGPAFAPCVPEVRTEVRREVQVPENVHIVPGNQCFHLYNPCYAFRHRGTQERVQTLRICEYCVRHRGRNPQSPTPQQSLDEILRAGMMPNFDRPGANLG
ncbi:RE1, partial [Symbiodinium sp. CCMP2456]